MMQRRSFIKTVGGIGVATAAGGAALLAASGPAAAATEDYGNVTIASDDGTVEYVAIYGNSTVEWEGFENTATEFSIDIDGRVVDQTSWIDLHETDRVALDSDWGNDEALSGPGTSGTIESTIGLDEDGNLDETSDWHVVGDDPDGYGLPDDSIDPSALETDGDGNVRNFTIEVRSTYTWYDAEGNEEFEKTFTAPVSVEVENIPRSAEGSGSGGAHGA